MTKQESLALAERAARVAGAFLASNPDRSAGRLTETMRDIKLRADRDAEDRIVDVLDESHIAIVAEERSGEAEEGTVTGPRWIVDPLDGTMNYVQGIPFCCVSVALWEDDEPVAGAVYDFDHNEMFSAIVGVGAWLNGSAMCVRKAKPERAVLCTGFPVGTDFTPVAVSRFVEQVRTFRKVRLLGSAALSLAYVASGRADVYFERDIRIWDVAAGLALVRGAGGAFVSAPSPLHHALSLYAHNGDCPWPEPVFT